MLIYIEFISIQSTPIQGSFGLTKHALS
jgi:hypothetical protein